MNADVPKHMRHYAWDRNTLSCPVCGIGISCVQGTIPEARKIIRRRVCKNGHHFKTVERPRLQDLPCASVQGAT
jgi:transcriptional regulator NrdR family protein